MPFDRSKYPDNWKEFSRSIRIDRAKGMCECTGQCGGDHCPDIEGDGVWCGARNGEQTPAGGKVVLTVAHLNADGGKCDCDPRCANPDHVLAMCQSCHLAYDRPRHVRNRKRNHRAKLAHKDLFDDE